jgi:glycosyltransferase involved in cell wall biosynthesis
VRLLVYAGSEDWGGAEVVLGHLLAGLPDDVEVMLLGVNPVLLSRLAERRPGTPTAVVPRIRGRRDWRAIVAHRRAIASMRPDIVQINLPVPFRDAYTVLAAVTVPRARVVVVEHLPMPIRFPSVLRLKRRTEPRLGAHLAVGVATAREIERLSGLPEGSISAVHNGVPTPHPPAEPLLARPSGARLVVGAIGRLDEQKGVDRLVAAAEQTAQVHLLLVGDGPERAALEARAAVLGLTDRVTVTGWTDRATDYLSSLDVLALSSDYEGLPLVVLEAMHAGLPVVASDVGSVAEAVAHEQTGLLVPAGDEAALAAALARLRDDPGLRHRLGEAGRRRAAEQFTVEQMVTGYLQVYADVLRRSERSSGGRASRGRRR